MSCTTDIGNLLIVSETPIFSTTVTPRWLVTRRGRALLVTSQWCVLVDLRAQTAIRGQFCKRQRWCNESGTDGLNVRITALHRYCRRTVTARAFRTVCNTEVCVINERLCENDISVCIGSFLNVAVSLCEV